ncbi:MAG TPA: hypothetical protein PLB21_00220 [Actinomycetota bacterium]|nr:hypothetical protein [Actinomycetota bacterium]
MTTTTLPAATRTRNHPDPVERARQLGTAAALLAMPAIFVFAFATHPELGSLRPLEPAELILRARGNPVLQFAHALVTLNTALLVVVAVHLQSLRRTGRGAWASLVGGAMAVLGACLLAADKGAMCLTMSALDSLDDTTFTAMMPGLVAIFDKQGSMVLIWGMVLLPLGVAVQAIGLIRARQWPTWQAVTLLAGSLLIAAPDGMEIINLAAALALLVALMPEAVRLARDTSTTTPGSAASRCRTCRHRLAAAATKRTS